MLAIAVRITFSTISSLGPARPRESRPITFSSRSSAIAPAASSTPTKHSETASA